MSTERTNNPTERFDQHHQTSKTRHEAEIPSILTNSAIEILREYTTDILEIKASASTDVSNSDSLIREYGLDRKQTQRQTVELNYQAITDNYGEIQNPLTEDAVADIEDKIKQKLNGMTTDADPDLAVQKLVINATLPEVAENTRALCDTFELTFSSDYAEDKGEERDPHSLTRLRNSDRRLYSDLGFQIRNLNLRRVIDTRSKYTEQTNGTLFGWGGPTDVAPPQKPVVVDAICDFINSEYSYLKQYAVMDDDDLVLIGGGEMQ